MKWLITGGCGFIGSSLIGQLVSEGSHVVRVLDNLSVGTKEDLTRVCKFSEGSSSDEFPEKGVELIVGDILDQSLAQQITRGADVIVHLAANTGVGPSVEDPRGDCLANVIGTLNYLEGARLNAVRRFVFASSGAPVGECVPPIHEELPAHPVSPYGASKLAGEGYCSAYYHSFDVDTVALRFGNVYGPGSGHKNSVVAKFIKQAMEGETLEIYGDGKQTRDFIYIDDLVRVLKLSATKDYVGGEIFQIATNKETTLQELVDVLLPKLAEAGFESISVTHVEKRTGDVLRNFSDTSKASRILGWRSEVTLVKGLEEAIKWFSAKRLG